MAEKLEALSPSLVLLVKLGSLAVHAEEVLSPNRHQFDVEAIRSILNDDEVRAWLKQMDSLAFLPKKR